MSGRVIGRQVRGHAGDDPAIVPPGTLHHLVGGTVEVDAVEIGGLHGGAARRRRDRRSHRRGRVFCEADASGEVGGDLRFRLVHQGANAGEAAAGDESVSIRLDAGLGGRMLFFRARRYDEAIRASEEALDLDPNFVNALWWQALSYAGKGDFPKALARLTKAASMNDGSVFRGLLGYVSARTGDRAKALAILDELTARARQRFVSPMDFAVVYAGLGDTDATFAWLEKAYQAHDVGLRGLASLCFDSVRSDPRYPDLMRRVGSPK